MRIEKRTALFFKSRWVILVVAIVGLASGFATAQLMRSEAHDLDLPECYGYDRFSFEVAESLDALSANAGWIIRGTLLEWRSSMDTKDVYEGTDLEGLPEFHFPIVVHDVQINEVLKGELPGQVIEVASGVGHCMDPGAEYYMFLNPVEEQFRPPVENPDIYRQEPLYSTTRFGKANFFVIEDERVKAEEMIGFPGDELYADIAQSDFDAQLSDSIARVSEGS